MTFCLRELLRIELTYLHIYLQVLIWTEPESTFSCPIFFARQHTDARYWYSNSVRLSVCLSVYPSVRDTLVLYENGLTYRHSFFHRTVAQSFCCFYQHQTSSRNANGVTSNRSAKYRWGIKISRFSTNKSLYFANDTRYRHSYYGRRIGNRIRSIKWCHFQWS